MKNSEILNQILKTLEKEHINLYHDVSKQEIEDYISKISDIDSLSRFEFEYEMRKLFAKFKDGHTQYEVPKIALDKKLVFVQGKMYVKDGETYKEIKSIGGMDSKEVIKKFAEMQCCETKAYLKDCINEDINNFVSYIMLKLVNNDFSIDCVVDNNGQEEKITLNEVSNEKNIETKKPNYNFEVLDNNVLRINYRECKQQVGYPFDEFIQDVKNEIESKEITQFVVDLRGNHGGNSGIIIPLIETLKELKDKSNIDVVVLIDNGVFSSGRWAVADLKANFDVELIGEPTGGATVSYGHLMPLALEVNPNWTIRYTASKKKFDLRERIGFGEHETGSIQPDIYVPKTIQDMQENRDVQLETALEYLAKQAELQNDECQPE